MSKYLDGGCLCGSVLYKVKDEFSTFHLCHCSQCQKITGSAYASNVFTHPDNIKWLEGKDLLIRYEDPNRDFSNAFCKKCGSGLPFLTKNGKQLIVPAGTLEEQPTIKPQDNIFWPEHISWLEESAKAKRFEGFAE